jgi:hypothetical protein
MSKKNRRQKIGKPPAAARQRRGPNATLDEHEKHGNMLQPPLAGLFAPVSWINERLPEMLWASSSPRPHKIFRIVAQWVPRDAGHPFSRLTLTGIAAAPAELRQSFFQRLLSPAAREALTLLLLLPDLPGLPEWQSALGRQPSEIDDLAHRRSALELWRDGAVRLLLAQPRARLFSARKRRTSESSLNPMARS